MQIYREVTVDAAILDDPASAPETIDRVLRHVVESKRPGYLEIPRDRVTAPVADRPGRWLAGRMAEAPEALAGAIDEAVDRDRRDARGRASRPALYVGVGVRRHGLTDAVVRLAERLRLPVVTDLLGKAAFPESHPQFAGVYLGALGDPVVRELLDGSDCVLGIGVMATDLGTGLLDPAHRPESTRDDRPGRRPGPVSSLRRPADGRGGRRACSTGSPAEPIARCRDVDGPALRRAPDRQHRRRSGRAHRDSCALPRSSPCSSGLDQSRYSFVADVGDSWFIGLELRADVFVAAGYYSSMGFAVPAALGRGIAEPSRRPFVIVGDGAFQMTGTELATHVDQGLRPIVLLLNNGGYGMLEAIDRPRRYYERRELGLSRPGPIAGRRGRASRQPRRAPRGPATRRGAPGAYLIEAFTARDDLSPVMARIRTHVHSAFRIQTGL